MADEGEYPFDDRADIRWWKMEGEKAGRALADSTKRVMRAQSGVQERFMYYLRLYRNLANVGYVPLTFDASQLMGGGPLSMNVTRSMVNTMHSKITKAPPRVMFTTKGAGYEARKKARLLGQYSDGLAGVTRLHKTERKGYLDCQLFGNGAAYVFERDRKVNIERAFIGEILVDEADGQNGDPRQMRRVQVADRRVLCERHPNSEEAIMRAPRANRDDMWWGPMHLGSEAQEDDLVRIFTSWHLASGSTSDDGRMAIALDRMDDVPGALLEMADWKLDKFPIPVVRWSDQPLGWLGMGLVEELAGIQRAINRLLKKIDIGFHLLSHPYILADRASNLTKGHVTDVPGSFIHYTGREPRVWTPSTVHQEVFLHLDRLYQRAFEIAGVSQLSAQAQRPPGIESGRGVLVLHDIETERFATEAQAFVDWHMEIMDLCIETAKSIHGYKVNFKEGTELHELEWKDIDLERDAYEMEPYPVSFFSGTPSAKMEMGERFVSLGIVTDRTSIIEMLGVNSPDIEKFIKRETAPRALVEKMCERMIEKDISISPEPAMDLKLALDVAQLAYLEAKLDDVPVTRRNRLLGFMTECKRLIAQAEAAEAALAAESGGALAPPPASLSAGGGPPPMGAPPDAINSEGGVA